MIHQTRNAEELNAYLKLSGIEVEREFLESLFKKACPEAKEAWGGLGEEILYVFSSEDDNVRIPFLTSGEVWETTSKNPCQTHLHAGNFYYDRAIFLFRFDREVASKLAACWKSFPREVWWDTPPVEMFTREEFDAACERIGYIRPGHGDLDPLSAQIEMESERIHKLREERAKEIDRRTGGKIKIGRHYIKRGKKKYGIGGESPLGYLVLDGGFSYYERFFSGRATEEVDASIERLMLKILSDLYFATIYHEEGSYKLWLGRFPVDYQVVKKGKRTCRYLEGVKLGAEDVEYALHKSRGHKKSEFKTLLKGLRKEPIAVRMAKRQGISFRGYDRSSGECDIHLSLEKKGRKWHARSPVSDKTYYISGGLKTIRRINRWVNKGATYGDPYCFPVETFAAYRILSECIPSIPSDELIEIIKDARRRALEAKKRAEKLLKDLVKKHKARIRKGRFRRDSSQDELEGYIVKGMKRNYFLSSGGEGIWTYPEGRYVCVVDQGRGRSLPGADRLANRILLCLNDMDLEDQVETMRDCEGPHPHIIY